MSDVLMQTRMSRRPSQKQWMKQSCVARFASLSRAAETTEVGTGGAGGPRLGGGGGPPPRFAVGEGPGGPFLRGGGAFLRLPPLAAALMGGGGIRPGRPRPSASRAPL